MPLSFWNECTEVDDKLYIKDIHTSGNATEAVSAAKWQLSKMLPGYFSVRATDSVILSRKSHCGWYVKCTEKWNNSFCYYTRGNKVGERVLETTLCPWDLGRYLALRMKHKGLRFMLSNIYTVLKSHWLRNHRNWWTSRNAGRLPDMHPPWKRCQGNIPETLVLLTECLKQDRVWGGTGVTQRRRKRA